MNLKWLWLLISVPMLRADGVHAEPPEIVVSKETTYITEPLGEDGLPDYRRAMLELVRKNKAPAAENGAALFWQTVGVDSIEEEYREAFCRELGIEVPKDGGALQLVRDEAVQKSLTIWILRQQGHEVDDETYDAFQQQNAAAFENASQKAFYLTGGLYPMSWPVGDIPPLSQWMLENNWALDQIVEATKCKVWYSPSPELLAEVTSVDVDVSRLIAHRGVAESLAARAMMLANAGDFDAALVDVDAVHRLGRHYPVNLLIDLLIAQAIRCMEITTAELAIIESADARPAVLRALMANHRPMPFASQLPRVLRIYERLFALNWWVQIACGSDDAREVLAMLADVRTKEQLEWLLFEPAGESLDWNLVLRMTNSSCEFTADAINNTALSRLKEVEDAYVERFFELRSMPKTQEEAQQLSPQERAKLLTYASSQMQLLSTTELADSEARHETKSRLMYVSIALALYRAEHGGYPESLDELVPAILDVLPTDAYGNEKLGYRKTDEGFLLYSYGLNGKDDQGCHNDMNILFGYVAGEHDDQVRKLLGDELPGKGILSGYIPFRSDDIAVRLPLLKLEITRP